MLKMNKKETRKIIEHALYSWNATKIDKTLLMIEFVGRVKDGEFD